MYNYDEQFFQYTNRVSARSAEVVVPLLYEALRPKSVLDLGCGCGIWLAQWLETGAADVLGVDGGYVSEKDLAIPPRSFMARDLSAPLDLGRRFDLAQSLEVAEHLQEPRARGFVADLCRHSDLVVFGAAPPGSTSPSQQPSYGSSSKLTRPTFTSSTRPSHWNGLQREEPGGYGLPVSRTRLTARRSEHLRFRWARSHAHESVAGGRHAFSFGPGGSKPSMASQVPGGQCSPSASIAGIASTRTPLRSPSTLSGQRWR
jgi:hypothetical protein